MSRLVERVTHIFQDNEDNRADLIMDIEDEFNIEIDDEEAERCDTIFNTVQYLKKRRIR